MGDTWRIVCYFANGMCFAFYGLLLALIYVNSLRNDFVFDDLSAVKENADLRPNETSLVDLFKHDFWGTALSDERSHKSYRPITVLTFRLNYWLDGLNPRYYHAVNILLHWLNTILFHLCVQSFGFITRVAVLASLLFAAAPIHIEAVTGVVGRAECLSCAFFLIAILAYVRFNNQPVILFAALLALSALATFSKEQGITVLGVLAAFELLLRCPLPIKLHDDNNKEMMLAASTDGRVYELILNRLKSRRFWNTRLASLCAIACSLLALRLYALQGSPPEFMEFDNPAAHSRDLKTRVLTFHYLLALNAWLVLCPVQLLCDWSMGTVPLITTFGDLRNLWTIALYAALGIFVIFALRSNAFSTKLSVGKEEMRNGEERCFPVNSALLSLSLCIIPFLPATNLFVYVGFVVAERVLYVPSAGFALLVSEGFARLCNRWHSNKQIALLYFAFSVLLFSFCAKTYLRNFDWQDDKTLFESELKFTLNNAKAFNNIGHWYEGRRNFSMALLYFRHAAKIQPNDIGALNNVGRVLLATGKLKIIAVLSVLRVDQNRLSPKLSMTAPQQHKSSESEYVLLQARSLLTKTRRISPAHLNVFINLGNSFKQQNRLVEALAILREAIELKPNFLSAYTNLGDVLLASNRLEDAVATYSIGLSHDPGNVDFLYNLGIAYLKWSNTPSTDSLAQAQTRQLKSKALEYFEAALSKNPLHLRSLVNSAMLLQETALEANADSPAIALAQRRFETAAQLDAADASICVQLALFLTDLGRLGEAEKWFAEAVQREPTHRSALYNLALLQIQLRKHAAALANLKLLTNHHAEYLNGWLALAEVVSTMKHDPELAEEAYLNVLKLDANNVQARHNLCIVYINQKKRDLAEQCLLKASQLLTAQVGYKESHFEFLKDSMKRLLSKV